MTMEQYEILLTESAQRDLMEIYTYIAKTLREPGTARGIYRAMKAAILSLDTMPERYGLLSEPPYAQMGMRKMLAKNYIVFYLVDKSAHTVSVVRILYNRREWQALLGTDFAQ